MTTPPTTRPVGRPPIGAIIAIRIPPDLVDALDDAAAARDTTRAAEIRRRLTAAPQ